MRIPFCATWRIIAAALLVLALAGCSMLRLGYNQGPELVYWWLDGYADFTDEQTPRVRDAIGDWFAWHRHEQLPGIAEQLARAQREVLQPTDAAAVCAWQERLRERVDVAFDRAVPAVAALALTLRPEQLRHIERRQAKANDEFRRDFLQDDPAERQRATLERWVERAQTLYGRLDAAQRERLAKALAAGPHDAELWFAERRARQQDVLRTVRHLQRHPDEAQASVRALAERSQRSPRPVYRAHQQRLAAFQCALIADLHNGTTTEQRQAARARLAGWEADLRALTGRANGG